MATQMELEVFGAKSGGHLIEKKKQHDNKIESFFD